MSNLEKLYYNMEKLNDDYADTEEMIEARNKLKGALGRKMYIECEEQLVEFESISEKQGFICGFQYAVSLMTSGKVVNSL